MLSLGALIGRVSILIAEEELSGLVSIVPCTMLVISSSAQGRVANSVVKGGASLDQIQCSDILWV